MRRLQMAVVIVILAYATFNGLAGYSLAKAQETRSMHYASLIEEATR